MIYYTYYSYEPFGRGYIGSRGCECNPVEDNYFGSYRDKTFNPSCKITLIVHPMKFLLPLLLLTTPVYAGEYVMPCQHVKEVAEVVMEDPYLSEKDKKTILRNLLGRHGMGCISRDAHD